MADFCFLDSHTIPITNSATAQSIQPDPAVFLTKPILPVNTASDMEAGLISQQVVTLVPAYPLSRPQTYHFNNAPLGCSLDEVNILARTRGHQA